MWEWSAARFVLQIADLFLEGEYNETKPKINIGILTNLFITSESRPGWPVVEYRSMASARSAPTYHRFLLEFVFKGQLRASVRVL